MEPSSNVNNFRRAMTQAKPPTSLSNLVDRLVAFLRAVQERQKPSPSIPVPAGIAHAFDSFSHHLVALMLVARSDDKVVAAEREVIFRYCLSRARKAGLELSPAEEEALTDYLRHFRPTLPYLISATDRLKQDQKGDVAELVAAAREVIEADGKVRLQEALYFDSLQHDLSRT
jgi:hypothetical protein